MGWLIGSPGAKSLWYLQSSRFPGEAEITRKGEGGGMFRP